jgi:hypothetical protein
MRIAKWMGLPALVSFGLVSVALGPVAMADDECAFRADRKAGVDTGGVTKVVIRAGAGDLEVIGRADTARIDASGQACATKQAQLDEARIEVRREGNVVYVETRLPQDEDGGSWGRNGHAHIDLKVALPTLIAVDAVDSSGDASFADLKSLAVQDSSGDLEVARIAGGVDVGDSSGDVEIRGAGSVRVRDSSGDLDIDEVHGDVAVEVDSSGDIEIAKVDGNVRIGQDSSGGIRIEDVRGGVMVDSDSSGDIFAGRVRGDFTVRSDSSGSIRHESVGGNVSVPRERADE